jgi:hypothetical protein
MCVLKGFNTMLARTTTNVFPFGLWFANPDTLYVADEGSGATTFSGGTYTAAAAQTTAGLQKWVFGGTRWKLACTLRAGLDLGRPYTVRGYPPGTTPRPGCPGRRPPTGCATSPGG